jgi:hypothetical protein
VKLIESLCVDSTCVQSWSDVISQMLE